MLHFILPPILRLYKRPPGAAKNVALDEPGLLKFWCSSKGKSVGITRYSNLNSASGYRKRVQTFKFDTDLVS